MALMDALHRMWKCFDRKPPHDLRPDMHAKVRRDLETAIKVARRSRMERLASSGNVIEDLARGARKDDQR